MKIAILFITIIFVSCKSKQYKCDIHYQSGRIERIIETYPPLSIQPTEPFLIDNINAGCWHNRCGIEYIKCK